MGRYYLGLFFCFSVWTALFVIIDSFGFEAAKYDSSKEVTINSMAAVAVNFPRRPVEPLTPIIVSLEPPKAAPIPAPFPA